MSHYERLRVDFRTAMDAPPDIVFNENGVKAYASLIPYDDDYATKVWFVSGDNGDEFGQYPNKSLALSAAIAVSKMNPQQRQEAQL